ERWRDHGQAILEQEAARQFYDDGTYSMHALNYQRSVLQTYLFALRLGEVNNRRFSDTVYQRVARSAEFLFQLVDPKTGFVPAYGSNDGSLLLPLNDCDFNDFRPALQLALYLTRRTRLFPSGCWDEDIAWFYGDTPFQTAAPPEQASASFPVGGYYVLRDQQSYTLIHCAHYQDRPNHSDQLHVDVWWRGVNVACDAGTYHYHAPAPWDNGLALASVHNTVMVDEREPMTRLSRFTWVDWAQGQGQRRRTENKVEIWEGFHRGYAPIIHRRSVARLGDDTWLIVDRLAGTSLHRYRLHWLLSSYPYELDGKTIQLQTPAGAYACTVASDSADATLSVMQGDEQSTRGWRSRYYGQREPALSAALVAQAASVTFYTLFAPPTRSLSMIDGLQVESARWSAAIDLGTEPLIQKVRFTSREAMQ
ncbi:MAG TPA: alginate lyase family protein, partial [Phototrophicaceae bacterium]|nr:alginate lyase family protein [Phototrophicaceae bacterium]